MGIILLDNGGINSGSMSARWLFLVKDASFCFIVPDRKMAQNGSFWTENDIKVGVRKQKDG